MCLSVCLLSHISPLEHLFILKILSRTQQAMEVKTIVGFSLKPLCCRYTPLPALYGYPFWKPTCTLLACAFSRIPTSLALRVLHFSAFIFLVFGTVIATSLHSKKFLGMSEFDQTLSKANLIHENIFHIGYFNVSRILLLLILSSMHSEGYSTWSVYVRMYVCVCITTLTATASNGACKRRYYWLQCGM